MVLLWRYIHFSSYLCIYYAILDRNIESPFQSYVSLKLECLVNVQLMELKWCFTGLLHICHGFYLGKSSMIAYNAIHTMLNFIETCNFNALCFQSTK
jgi:hypothetical protein